MADEYDKEHPDAPQDAEQLRPIVESLVKAVQMLAERIDHISNAHGALEKLVTDDLIGGIHSMYIAKMRGDRIESLKTRFGGDLQDSFDVLSQLSPEGTDHWGALADMTDGMDDEGLGEHIKGLSQGLAEKIAKIRGGTPGAVKVESVSAEPVTEEGAAPAAAEEATEPEAEPALSKDEKIAAKLSKTKGFKLR